MGARGAVDSAVEFRAVGRYRGLRFLAIGSWGSAPLHPRLYAIARYRGLALVVTDTLSILPLFR